jgi:hypothetical protein
MGKFKQKSRHAMGELLSSIVLWAFAPPLGLCERSGEDSDSRPLMDATTVSLAVLVDWPRYAGQMSTHVPVKQKLRLPDQIDYIRKSPPPYILSGSLRLSAPSASVPRLSINKPGPTLIAPLGPFHSLHSRRDVMAYDTL